MSSSVEYQGIAIVKHEIPKIEKEVNKRFTNVRLRPNLHVCLDYFGLRKQSDTHIIKTQDMFKEKTMGRQVSVPVIGIGYYERKNADGKYELMNVSLLVDDSSFDQIIVEDKVLTDFNKKNMPWITLFTNPKTIIMNDKEYPVSTAKHSGKCFGLEELDENERCHMDVFDDPLMLAGELCVFRGPEKFYHIQDDTTRLITWKSLREKQDAMLETEFEKES